MFLPLLWGSTWHKACSTDFGPAAVPKGHCTTQQIEGAKVSSHKQPPGAENVPRGL